MKIRWVLGLVLIPGLVSAAEDEGAITDSEPASVEPSDSIEPVDQQGDTEGAVEFGASTDSGFESSASGDVPYMQRYLPKAKVFEISGFVGLFLPSGAHSLMADGQTIALNPAGNVAAHQQYDWPAFTTGARIAYYPLNWLGIEALASMAHGNLEHDLNSWSNETGTVQGGVSPALRLNSNRAYFFSYRAQLIGQLPYWSIVPYGLVGVGALGVSSQPLGGDTDVSFNLGAGLKFPIMEDLAIRTEFVSLWHERINDNSFAAFSHELTAGLAFTWGGAKAAEPEPAAEAPADRDGDHVPDEQDACPDVPALTEDGCPLDTDGDGVVDPDDHCPRQAGTLPNGCPDLDKDGDGVPDACDQCPDEPGEGPTGCMDPDGDGIKGSADKCPLQPETANGYQDADGCPDEIPEDLKKFTGRIEGIFFNQGKATIQKRSEKTLHAAADILKKYPSTRVEVSGHTSSEGSLQVNEKLSVDRAESVREWLIRAGVAPEQITSRGAGPHEPVADNKTYNGRMQNRRIEFTILK